MVWGAPTATAIADWYDDDWPYRVKVTVDDAYFSESATDFRIYVDLSDLPSDFWDNVQNSGEIRVTASDEVTQLPHELVNFTDNGSS